MKYRIKLKMDIAKGKSDTNLAEVIKKSVIPNIEKNMREILFTERSSSHSTDTWGQFKQAKAGLLARSTMEYLEKTKAVNKTQSYVKYIPGSPKDSLVFKIYLTDDTQTEDLANQSPEYIMDTILSFNEQQAQQIFDRVVREKFER